VELALTKVQVDRMTVSLVVMDQQHPRLVPHQVTHVYVLKVIMVREVSVQFVQLDPIVHWALHQQYHVQQVLMAKQQGYLVQIVPVHVQLAHIVPVVHPIQAYVLLGMISALQILFLSSSI
jgi:hypothetical protein